ncbi:hypothetical protein [Mucilaginibacter antarcticus]|uniref:Uncharacterized protein n=1 Tax=Mucilaginibacter antarcticus TaxID=1855725 RepID=A0ABW5XJ90_9SPHI
MINETNFNSVMEDFTKELQAVKEVVKVLPAKVEELTKKVDGFKSKIENIQVTAPAPELLPVHKIIADGFTTTKNSVQRQLNDLFIKNRILVLPEDGGKSFLKIMGKRFMILTALALTIGFISRFGFRYWYMNSENTRYRKWWYWNYIKLDKNGKQEMFNDLDSFKVADISSYRTDSIERYQKGGNGVAY